MTSEGLGPWLTAKLGKDGTYVLALLGLGIVLVGGLVPIFGDSPYFPYVLGAAAVQIGAIALSNKKKEAK